MAEFGLLRYDFSFDVLSRLPAKELLQLKCVSSGWNQLLSNRVFTKVQSQKREPVSGFFLQQRYQWCNDDVKTISYASIQSEHTTLQQTVFSFLPEDVVVLASCNGLICCRSCYPFEDPVIYVCNPVNREWTWLNFTKPEKETSIALAFDPYRDIGDVSTYFKLVRVEQFENESEELYFSFHIFSSDKKEWRSSKEICLCNDKLYKNKGTYIKGILHWLTEGDKILTFNVENELAWLVSVPIASSQFQCLPGACIGECNGQLHYVMVSEEGIHVWYLEDYLEFNWTLKHTKTLEKLEEEFPGFFYNLRERVLQSESVWIDPMGFEDGYLLIKASYKIYMYNVEANEMKFVCMVSELGEESTVRCPAVFPYSLSLVPLFDQEQ